MKSITKEEITIIEKEYFKDLQEIKEIIKRNRNKAMVIVNSAMIISYYETGVVINKRKKWGNKYIERLANDLKEHKGYSKQNLYRMSQLANEFSYNEIFSQPGGQIPWRTLIEIMHKSSNHNEMLWYIEQSHKNGWSRSMVVNQIAMKSYERSLISPIKTKVIEKSDDLINEIFKDTYVFDFLDKESICSFECLSSVNNNENNCVDMFEYSLKKLTICFHTSSVIVSDIFGLLNITLLFLSNIFFSLSYKPSAMFFCASLINS